MGLDRPQRAAAPGRATKPARRGAGRDAGRKALPVPALAGRDDEDSLLEVERRLTLALAPRDAIEKLWVEDLVHHAVEVRRLRDLRGRLLTSSIHLGLRELLARQIETAKAGPLAYRWSKGDTKARARVSAILSRAGLTMDDAMALTIEQKLDSVERLDRMIANLEARRHVVLREVDRHRAALGSRTRAVTAEIEDAPYAEVPRDEPPTPADR